MPRVDLANYVGREQAYVKHYLLEKYLTPLAYKVGSTWDSIVYVDGFSGPWQTNRPDHADSSFSIAINTLREARAGLLEKGRNLQIGVVLVEEDASAFTKLKDFATDQSADGFWVQPLSGEFIKAIPDIERLLRTKASNPFKFTFLDPKGWADIPMKEMQNFLKGRSGEVLINLMTRHIIRFLEEEDRAESYKNLFGRNGVLDLLKATPRENNERADVAVREYCKSLKRLCGFKYVSSAVILEPDKESVKYFLVYGTNNFHGIDVFKAAESAAARIQDEVRYSARPGKPEQAELFLAGGSRQSRIGHRLYSRYRELALRKVIEILAKTGAGGSIPYRDVYCEAMAFPLVSPADLMRWLEDLKPNVSICLGGTGKRRMPSPGKDDRVTVLDKKALPSAT